MYIYIYGKNVIYEYILNPRMSADKKKPIERIEKKIKIK